MKAVIIGPGRIGCGLTGQLLHASGYQVVFVARNPVLVNHLNRVGHYRVRLVNGPESRELSVTGIRAVSMADTDRVLAELAQADLIATAVGPGNLAEIAPLIAAGLEQRQAPANVLAFENMNNTGSYLRTLVGRHLANSVLQRHGFSGALVSRAVTHRLGDPAMDQPLVFIGDPPTTFVVDGSSLKAPLPIIEGMVVADDYTGWVRRKLYTYSAGHATTAYLGYLKGYHYVHTAIRDPEIRATVLAAMAEGQRGLAARYGQQVAGDEHDLREIVARFENAALDDPIVRVGRDPRRKLGAEERLVGAARLAVEAGVIPEKLAMAAAAALCFDSPADPSAADLQQQIRTAGPGLALSQISGLDPRRGLGRLVTDVWHRLTRGWHHGNQLLSLDQLMWAYS
ncbi:MAG: mannitol-1-phosphate 5-dehydrogenase [Anaerolineae bacterium]